MQANSVLELPTLWNCTRKASPICGASNSNLAKMSLALQLSETLLQRLQFVNVVFGKELVAIAQPSSRYSQLDNWEHVRLAPRAGVQNRFINRDSNPLKLPER